MISSLRIQKRIKTTPLFVCVCVRTLPLSKMSLTATTDFNHFHAWFSPPHLFFFRSSVPKSTTTIFVLWEVSKGNTGKSREDTKHDPLLSLYFLDFKMTCRFPFFRRKSVLSEGCRKNICDWKFYDQIYLTQRRKTSTPDNL